MNRKTAMQSLEGKFVLWNGPESYRTGQIKTGFEDSVMVQFDRMGDNSDASWNFPMELVCGEELTHAVEDGLKVWGFFDTRQELDAFLAWLDSPSEKQVVRLVSKPRQH